MRIYKKFFYGLFVLLVLFSTNLKAQVIYTPPNSPVYNYLDRLAAKHILLNYFDEVKPFSRNKIARYLEQAELNVNKLNSVEKDELEWYKEEYAHEMKLKNERWFLFKYSDTLFTIRLSPKAGYGISSTGNQRGHTRWWGIRTYGTISNWLGAFFSYKDIGEFGGNVDDKMQLTPHRGYYINARPKDGIEFSDVKGGINLNWKWGSVSLIKDDIQWGHGKFGQLILSPKPESYPQIRLYLHPVKWFRFYYLHGWLNSLVIDSAATYYNHLNSIEPIVHQQYIGKYIAANLLSITPIEYLDVSVGNSVIYSGNLKPEYFIPFLYYKVMDHNTGRGGVDDANGQIFIDVSSRNLKNFQFYGTVFIDAASIRKTLSAKFYDNWFGYTVGIKRVGLGLSNLDMTLEYTKISPWVYDHKYDTETYTHIGYTLGDWIGQNADLFKIQFDYKPTRPLTLHLGLQNFRKGGLKDIYYAYSAKETQPFLYGPVRKDFTVSIKAQYEIIHNGFVNLEYKYSNISDQEANRTPGFMLGSKNWLSLILYYGF